MNELFITTIMKPPEVLPRYYLNDLNDTLDGPNQDPSHKALRWVRFVKQNLRFGMVWAALGIYNM